ncbi:cytochrome P450 [Mycena vulgaris]|nr:cytochrome P450 [Mycena vulgaris]KAJ6511768.1 cytochrome P450 [Mycena vulgaris]
MQDLNLLILPAFVALIAVLWLRKTWAGRQIDNIPAVSSSGSWEYYTGGFRYLLHAPAMVEEGCKRYPGRVFRVPRLFRWDFVLSGPSLINELASAPETVLSAVEGTQDGLQVDLTIGPEIFHNAYHIDIVRSTLTRNLGKCFPDLRDEITCSFDETLALRGTDWKLTPALSTVMTVVTRSVNRVFVGLPICRNEGYLSLVVQYTIDVVIRAQVINLLPSVLRPILGPLVSARNQSIRKGVKYLGSLLEYRIAQEKAFGSDWPGKPNDFISWLLELAEGPERTVPALVLRILATNMVAIHTTSTVFTHALFDLISHPNYFFSLRQEVEQVVKEMGWSKAALNRMHKVDSFLRESQRMHDNGPVTLLRKVLHPSGFRFSDGTFLPAGSIITAASRAEHFDPETYENPEVFDGFRFSKMREDRDRAGGEGVFNRHMVSTSVNHLAFGHKQHACPGRFFAATALKTMLAHLVVNYDVRAEMEGIRPPDDVFGIVVVPNRRAKIWFRKRQ